MSGRDYFLPALGAWFALAAACSPSPTRPPAARPNEAVVVEAGSAAALRVLASPRFGAYHGWIRYLQFLESEATAGEERANAARELDRWATRIETNPGLLSQFRGVIEWAYTSPVDGSGQPFQLNVPTDYDPDRAAPLSVYMHGYSGNHREHATDMHEHPGHFEVSVLGRSRGGGYMALSEADVLHVIDYVEQHWSIDSDRIHLTGGSMGGAGTFWLSSRYPQRFASGRIVCGAGSNVPAMNLLTVPLYATHSDDDFRVPVLHARGPLGALQRRGAELVYDEVTGYGHAVWEYREGNERGVEWTLAKARRQPSSVSNIDFTALDGTARRAYWAEVSRWGDEPRPARMQLRVQNETALALELDNVAALDLDLAASPLDTGQPVTLSLAGGTTNRAPTSSVTLPPGTKRVRVRASGGQLRTENSAAEPKPPHTPGGANLLYDGTPLLIVYGTEGSASERRAMRMAAEAASRSSNAGWHPPGPPNIRKDGVPHHFNLYGPLPVAADTQVDAELLHGRNLVLIGGAEQNSVVARLAPHLPVRRTAERIRFSDGLELSARDRVLALVYAHPQSPGHRLFWVSSDDARGYAAGALAPDLMHFRATGFDAIVTRATEPELIATRSFDSRWDWLSREASPLIELNDRTVRGVGRAVSRAVRRAAETDFAIATWPRARASHAGYQPGVTRLIDVTPYFDPISVATLTGQELAVAWEALESHADRNDTRLDWALEPAPSAANVDPEREYRVALTARAITPFVRVTQLAPQRHVLTELTAASALRRWGLSNP